jgi:hypothetical protein
MKRKHHPSGPGALAVDRFLEAIVRLGGGVAKWEPDGILLSFADLPADEFVAYSPSVQSEWTKRLKWVEKQSALALLQPPVWYKVVRSVKGRSPKSELRLSVVLSLSTGSPCWRRYTLRKARGVEDITISQGGNLSLPKGCQQFPLTALPVWAEKDLHELAEQTRKTCEVFKTSDEARGALATLAQKRRAELIYLQQLYNRKQDSHNLLYGLPEPGTAGSASIEAELQRLQGLVIERYAVSVRIRILSLGILEEKGS